MIETLDSLFEQFSGFLWGYPMIILLLGTHIFLTIRLRFVQRYLEKAMGFYVHSGDTKDGDISHFGALCVALAATIGTGNIIGVGTAVALGGPGAVFWCWLTGVLGMSTKYGEALLAIKYRVRTQDGLMLGGPMYVLERGMGQKWLGVLFCIFTAVAAFGIGNMVQANSLASLAEKTFHVPPLWTGIILSVCVGAVLLGGIKSIGKVCSFLVPFMALIYIVGCVIILSLHLDFILPAVELIVKSAFSSEAIGGGFIGGSVLTAMRMGIGRGLFSNESGMGSAPIAAAAAQTRNPVRHALVAYTGTFWDTVVVCALTGIVIVSCGLAFPDIMSKNGDELTHAAFGHIPYIGMPVLVIALATFVLSTLLGWSYYGEKAMAYLWGIKTEKPYRIVWVAMVFIGATTKSTLVWNFSDCANALMAIPNLLALLVLSGVIVAETRYYLWQNRLEEESKDEIPTVVK